MGVINLPAALQCHLAIPIKNANYKINLNTDIPCENVTTTTTKKDNYGILEILKNILIFILVLFV